jgi:dihydroxyacetone kinase
VSTSQVDLATLFAVARDAIAAHQGEINDLDGYNGNHGDNMARNMQLVAEALQQRRDQPPAAALQYASQLLQSQGHGGTSPYYAQGLSQAAQQLQGQSSLTPDDALSVVQSLLGAIPSQGHPQQPQTGGSVLDQVLGMSQAQTAQPQQTGSALGGLLRSLIPAALAFFQAKQSGADATSAAGQALMGALTGSQQVNPLQSGTPRAAAAGLIAQSVLRALAGGR